jgi:hypothetical protein
MTFNQRMQLFHEKLPELLATQAGKYALMCLGQVWVYASREQAVQAGFEKCGRPNDFLVMKIEPLKGPRSPIHR